MVPYIYRIIVDFERYILNNLFHVQDNHQYKVKKAKIKL